MAELLIYMLAALGILWFADELLTLLDIRRFGINREENPVIRWLANRGTFWLTAFKVFAFAVFIAIILFVNSMHKATAVILTGLAFVIYLIVVVRNFEIYEESA